MATRSAFNDDSYQMFRMDNVLDSVNLNVIGWNRATVADGQWLQDNAIGPLSARDMYLADCIDEAWGSINNIRQTLADMGAETTGVNLVGFTMKSLNVAQCNDPDAAYTDNNLGWKAKHTSLVTSGAGDTFMTPASLSYLSIGNQAEDLGDVALTLAAEQYGGILQINTTAKDAYQMAFTPGGIYYRHISPSDGTAQTQHGEKGDFTFMDSPPAFSALPLGAMTQAQADTRYLSITNFGTYTGTTAPGQFVSKTDYGTFTAKAITTSDITTTSYEGENYVIDISGMKVVSPTEIPAGGLVAVSHDATLTGDGTSTTVLGVSYAPSATNAGNLSGAAGTSSFAEITGAIQDKSVVTVSENAPWVSTITVDSTAHSIFNPYDHTSNLFNVTGADAANKKLELKYNTAVFSADSTNGLDFRVGSDFTLPAGGPLALASISLTGNGWAASHTKTISGWLQYIIDSITVAEPQN